MQKATAMGGLKFWSNESNSGGLGLRTPLPCFRSNYADPTVLQIDQQWTNYKTFFCDVQAFFSHLGDYYSSTEPVKYDSL